MRYHRMIAAALLGLMALLSAPETGVASEIPPWLPRYDLDIQLQLDQHQALVRQRITWINRHACPTHELVFNAHSHYKIPEGNDVAYLAKMLEILRVNPSEGLDFDGHALKVQKATLLIPPGPEVGDKAGHALELGQFLPPGPHPPCSALLPLSFHYREDNDTALVVPLPHLVGQGEAVTIELEFNFTLPQKQGRWGQWKGVTFLSNWLPVLAYYDDHGWQPTPFIPWHQPFFNEAGIFSGRVTLPCQQKLASSASVLSETDLGHGLKQVDFLPHCGRDFALLCSERFCEYTGTAGPVHVRCLAFPEHEHYAREMVRIACEAIPVYSDWFGPYPYPEFTLVESYFGWNGNECSGLVMIDERVFDMPHLAGGFVDSLVSHEVCHQWWYNVIGTNGYCETWMDEGMATYFSHRLLNCKHGKNNRLLTLPKGLEWLPNIDRETYRYYGLYGTIGRGEACKTVQDMPGFQHIVTLFSMCYDRGSKIVGMIEDRLGEAAFIDFMRLIYAKYQFRILRVADFQHELEEYTRAPWEEFFKHWLYGADMTDWCVEKVHIEKAEEPSLPGPLEPCVRPSGFLGALRKKSADSQGPQKVTVLLRQKADYNEQTVLGFCLDGGEGFQVRVPILPQVPVMELEDPPGKVEMLPGNRVRVEVVLPCRPTQIAVDPDQVLVDCEPANNYWKPRVRYRVTPLYSMLDETDLTAACDRWNFTAGPWIYGAAYQDPWFTRSVMVGLRAGVYRTQQFNGGVYAAYRTDYRDIAAGVDGMWDHWPWHHTQVGFIAERSLGTLSSGDPPSDWGVIYGRYVFQYGDSLYLPPMEYLEIFTSVQDNVLPPTRNPEPGANPFTHTSTAGVHYHKDYLTPYWDAEGGYRLDVTYAAGAETLGEHEALNKVEAQFSYVQFLPDALGPWLSNTRVAMRVFGGAALPNDGEFFTLGGGELFRGFDLKQRQGSLEWVGSLEWRVPLAQGLTWDCCDHTVGLRNVFAAAFTDVGDVYLDNHSVGGVAYAVGGGLRLDVAWFSLVERTILRFDVAKTVNANSPVQFWFGVQNPF